MAKIHYIEQALEDTGIPFLRNEPLAGHTTFRIGGPARVLCLPQNEILLTQAAALCRAAGQRLYFLGNGSNVLFADEGYDGVVLKIGVALPSIHVEGTSIMAGSGALLSKMCVAARDAGLTGLEFAYGIPGMVGGAVYMNAGAYDGELKDVLQSVRFLDEQGKIQELDAKELHLGYRTSVFEGKPWCLLSARFALQGGDTVQISQTMEDYMQRRRNKQPLELPSAGSTFKNPTGAFASALIDQSGLRGFRVGDAAISQKHCGFVVNLGRASCADVIALTDYVSRTVREKTGYNLEKEIRVVR